MLPHHTHLWEIDLKLAPGLPPGWNREAASRESTAGTRGEGNQLAWYQILHPRVVRDPSITFPDAPSAPAAMRHATPARLARPSNAQGSARASAETRWFEAGRSTRGKGADKNADEWGVDSAAAMSRARERHAGGIVDMDFEILVRGSELTSKVATIFPCRFTFCKATRES